MPLTWVGHASPFDAGAGYGWRVRWIDELGAFFATGFFDGGTDFVCAKSTDGVTWVGKGLRASGAPTVEVHTYEDGAFASTQVTRFSDIAYSASEGKLLAVCSEGIGFGLYSSTDGGETWVSEGNPLNDGSGNYANLTCIARSEDDDRWVVGGITAQYPFSAVSAHSSVDGLDCANRTPSDGDTVTIGSVTYTFKDVLTGAANEVKINRSYGFPLAASPGGASKIGTTVTLTAPTLIDLEGICAGDTIDVSGVDNSGYDGGPFTLLSVSGASVTYNGGAGALANSGGGFVADLDLPYGTLLNLSLALNASGTPGVNYGVGTVANPDVAAYMSTQTIVVYARVAGSAGNALACTNPGSGFTWSDSPTLAGGSDSGSGAVITNGYSDDGGATWTIGPVASSNWTYIGDGALTLRWIQELSIFIFGGVDDGGFAFGDGTSWSDPSSDPFQDSIEAISDFQYAAGAGELLTTCIENNGEFETSLLGGSSDGGDNWVLLPVSDPTLFPFQQYAAYAYGVGKAEAGKIAVVVGKSIDGGPSVAVANPASDTYLSAGVTHDGVTTIVESPDGVTGWTPDTSPFDGGGFAAGIASGGVFGRTTLYTRLSLSAT